MKLGLAALARGTNRTVGDASRFNQRGAVPTNTPAQNFLRQEDENDWDTGEAIYLLTGLAALLHDLGKASLAFQRRLRGELQERNQYRHEWTSLRLFEAFVGSDTDSQWLSRLADPSLIYDECWLGHRLKRDGLEASSPPPFVSMAAAPLARAIGWLVLTHHRLPVLPRQIDGSAGIFQVGLLHSVLDRIDAGWNERPTKEALEDIEPYWTFPHRLPTETELWRKTAARLAKRLIKLNDRWPDANWLDNPYVMHVSRLCLMLADHHYSGLSGKDEGRVQVPKGYPLYANTIGVYGQFNQTLDEHLIGVAQHSAEVTHALPRFEQQLPRLARHRILGRRSGDERFRWQDKAADCAAAMRERSTLQGAFIVNMASTGCGKTLANARIMYSLADPERGMRCAFAMGLRTLTLQTGRAFRDLLGLGDEDLAIRVGGAANRALFDYYEHQAESSGSASRQSLLDEDSHVVFEGNVDSDPLLRRVMHDPQVRALLAAPVLVCTIDHLTPATESQRGGRQIAPMLRLMSGDLVLDEPDDFDIGDLPALTRLVHWAGLLGARVLLSSATLPPALVQGLFEAYRNGRHHFERNRAPLPGASEREPVVCCAWFDEFHQDQADCIDALTFEKVHLCFAAQRHARLGREPARRRFEVAPLRLEGLNNEQRINNFAALVLEAAQDLHVQHNTIDPVSGKRVSFGLVRMANIEPLVDVSLALFKQGAPAASRIHLCTYHSQFPLLIRSAIEHQLDTALNRRDSGSVFKLAEIRARLDANSEADQIFIVLGSPVTEVGRDHDYDWAIVEPSSMRSLIQLAGRIRRHRAGVCTTANLRVFNTNLRHFHSPGEPAFCKPGFETRDCKLESHYLTDLLNLSGCDVIDARPRIIALPHDQLNPRRRLVDLEHARMRQTMLALPSTTAEPQGGTRRQRGSERVPLPSLNAAIWWRMPPADALLTAVLPQHQVFRQDTTPRVELLLQPNDEGDDYSLMRVMERGVKGRDGHMLIEVERSQHQRLSAADVQGQRIQPWGQTDYLQALVTLASELGLSLPTCARKFGGVSVPENVNGWRFHPALGFSKRK
jgi:CRISPR-associated endonuclease/helicase Cas3